MAHHLESLLGYELALGGTHPFHRSGTSAVFPAERYERIMERLAWLTYQRVVFGLHIHVGVPSGDTAVAVHPDGRADQQLGVETGRFGFVDSFGGRLRAGKKLVCQMTLRDGKLLYDQDGLARPDWETLPKGYRSTGDPRWDGYSRR